MGYFGAKLFLNSESPIFKYFKSQGVKISDINKINSISFCKPLDEKEIGINKSVLFSLYSKEAVNKKVSELIKIVDLKLKSN